MFLVLEIIGFILALSSVLLTIKERRIGWLLSILSGCVYMIIYARAHLYSDAELQLLYISIAVYGYVYWKKKTDVKGPVIHLMKVPAFVFSIGAVLTLTLVWGGLHSMMTDASLPYLDSLLASTCIVAQWMMAKKNFQCWYLWIFANIGYIAMYALKELTTTTVLYLIFFVVTINGYRRWKHILTILPAEDNLNKNRIRLNAYSHLSEN